MLKVIDKGIQALVFEKFKDILGLTDMNRDSVLYPKEVAFRQIAEKRGEAVTEFISLWREPMSFSWERQRTSVARAGIMTQYQNPVTKADIEIVRAVPVDLTYNVWFWTKNYEKYNEIAEKYLFWQQTNPNLFCTYDVDLPLEYDLHFGELADESTVDRMFDSGVYFVLRVPVKVDGWVFDTSTVKTIQKIVLKVYDNQIEAEPVLLYEETFSFLPPVLPSDSIAITDYAVCLLEHNIDRFDVISSIDSAEMQCDLELSYPFNSILILENSTQYLDVLYSDIYDETVIDDTAPVLEIV